MCGIKAGSFRNATITVGHETVALSEAQILFMAPFTAIFSRGLAGNSIGHKLTSCCAISTQIKLVRSARGYLESPSMTAKVQ